MSTGLLDTSIRGAWSPAVCSAALGGTITFTLYGPNDATCGNAAIFTNTKAVVSSGGGTGTATSNPFTPSQARSEERRVGKEGGTRRAANATTSNDPGETSDINQATPVLTTVATPTALVGGSFSHTANRVRGLGVPGVHTSAPPIGPNDATCGSAAIFTNTKAVVSSGGGTGTATSNPFTPSQA